MRILIAALALMASTAMAEEIKFSWEPPTERMNGVAFDVTTELDRYDIVCAVGDHEITEEVPGLSTVSQYAFDAVKVFGNQYGDYSCRMFAVDTYGLKSDAAGPVTVSWEPSPPKAPTLFQRIMAFIVSWFR